MNSYPYYVDPQYIKQQNEKKAIKTAANYVAAAFLVMSAVMTLWSFPVSAFAKETGFMELLVEAVNDTTLLNIFQIVISSLAFIPVYFVLAKILKTPLDQALSLKCKTAASETVGLLLLGVSFCGFSNFASVFAGNIFRSFGFSYTANIHHENPTNIFGIILSFIATAVTPAIIEEFAMRGVVLHSLKKYGDGFAILVSAGLFGLLHGNFEQIPFAFLLGLFLAFITLKTKSIVPAVLIHFYNNLSSAIYSYTYDYSSNDVRQFIFIFYMFIMLVVGALGLFLLRHKQSDFFSLSEGEGDLGLKEKLLTAAFSPVMIAVYVVVVWEIFFVYV